MPPTATDVDHLICGYLVPKETLRSHVPHPGEGQQRDGARAADPVQAEQDHRLEKASSVNRKARLRFPEA